MKRLLSGALGFGLVASMSLLATQPASAYVWSEWCNSSTSDGSLKIYGYKGVYVGSVPPGECTPFALNSNNTVDLPGPSHKVAYNGGAYSSCRSTPSGKLAPANKATIWFRTYGKSGCHHS